MMDMGLEKDGTGEGWRKRWYDLCEQTTLSSFSEDGEAVINIRCPDAATRDQIYSMLTDDLVDGLPVAPPSPDPHGAQATGGDWQAREGVLLKLQTLTDYEPTGAELAELLPEDRGVVKGWRMRGEAMAAGVVTENKACREIVWAAIERLWSEDKDRSPEELEMCEVLRLLNDRAAAATRHRAGSAEAEDVSDAEVEAVAEAIAGALGYEGWDRGLEFRKEPFRKAARAAAKVRP